MKLKGHNYERFQGWRLIALLGVFTTYTLWFIGPGPFGELTRLQGYAFLQGRGFYTGAEAVSAIESLSPEGRAVKYKALGLDLIYMVLQTWVFEAVIALSSFLALLLATSSEVIGSFAGVINLMKFIFFIPLVFLSFGFGSAGIVAIVLRKRKAVRPSD